MNLKIFFSPEASSINHEDIRQEFFRLGFGNLKVHLVAHTCLSTLVTLACYRLGRSPMIDLWVVYMVAIAFILIAGIYWFAKARSSNKPPAHVAKIWRTYHFILVCSIGLAWGCLGFFLVPGAERHNLMLFIAFAGTVGYSSASNGPHDFIGFVASAAIALGLLLSQIPKVLGSEAWAVQGMCLLYFFGLTFSARNAKSTLLSSILLRIENQQLAKKNAVNAERADKASKDKSAFLAAASHDLRQPLHALTLLLQTHQQQEPEAAKNPLLQNATVATNSITELVNGLMELSIIEAGQHLPAATLLNVTDVLRSVLQQFIPEGIQKNLKLRLFVSQRLSRQTILSDKALLERVLANLVSNSIRYTKRGGVLLSLRPASDKAEDGGLKIEVWDTGVGIAEVDRTRIFDPYVQLGNKERNREKGFGLGLSIVKGTVATLNFSLSLRSKVNQGSVFRVDIPRSFSRVDRLPSAAKVQKNEAFQLIKADVTTLNSTQANRLVAKRKILFVDDDEMVSSASLALFESWGADIRCAGSLGEAYTLLQATDSTSTLKWQPTHILSDFRLPGDLNGLEVLRLLKAMCPEAKCLLLTGEPKALILDKAIAANVSVLFKPIPPESLYQALL